MEMPTNYPEEENIKYFQKLKQEYPYAEQAYTHIISSINSFLINGDFTIIKSIINFIQYGDGKYAFSYIGSIHRILMVLYILQLEKEYNSLFK